MPYILGVVECILSLLTLVGCHVPELWTGDRRQILLAMCCPTIQSRLHAHLRLAGLPIVTGARCA